MEEGLSHVGELGAGEIQQEREGGVREEKKSVFP